MLLALDFDLLLPFQFFRRMFALLIRSIQSVTVDFGGIRTSLWLLLLMFLIVSFGINLLYKGARG